MSLVDYIPSQVEVNRCIKSVAEGAHEAVLLAVHQQAKISYRRVRTQEKIPANEAALIEHILSKDVASGSLVVPITGASGVGKSHLIRIIDARLRNNSETKHHLIIRIPKSASLREVVKLILEPLPVTQYRDVKDAFQNALAEVDIESAAIHIQGHLEVALRRLAASLREQAKTSGANQSLKERLFHAEHLPMLLNDAVTSAHYRANVLPRIVLRAVAGSGDALVLGTEGQFTADDIRLPSSVDLGQAAKPVSMYYRTGLLAREGQGFSVATEVLNKVVDEATRQLFRLQDSLGGMTLQEVILEIRRLLLSENRELILLVEDFAALTGIQETLANVLIQEGIRDGVAQYATMRSVIAVTDGYLVSRDTLATRAAREWIVESEIDSEQEILARTRAIVASYLNAARWGHEALTQRYAVATPLEIDRATWLPVFRRDDQDGVMDTLQVFGFENEIPLFPYTSTAIEQLARSVLRQGNALVFNPRFIIDEVLRSVLLPARDSFEKGMFPHPGVPAKEPSADVAQWIASMPGSESMRQRYRRVMVVWGNNPRSRSDLLLVPPGLYVAFGLPAPETSSITPTRPQQPTVRESIGQRALRVPDEAFVRVIEEQRSALERWTQDKVQLPQPVANAIRDELAELLNERIDANAERFLRCILRATDISIPGAGGEGRIREDSIKIAESNDDPDGSIRGDLIALLRLRAAKGRGDYPEFEDDLARSVNLADRLRPRALSLLRERNRKQLRLALIAFIASSRILGLPERGRTAKALASYLTATAPTPEAIQGEDLKPIFGEWRSAQKEASMLRLRMHRLLLNTCACFQGTGDTPLGLDIARLIEQYPDEGTAFEYKELDGATEDDRRQLASLSDVRVKARARAMLEELSRISSAIKRGLGDDFNKNDFLSILKDLASALAASGRWNSQGIGASPNEFGKLCEEFRSTAIKESLDQTSAALAPDTDSAEKFVTRIGQVKIGPLLAAERFLSVAERFLVSATAEVSSIERQVEGIDPAAGAAAIMDVFDGLQQSLTELSVGAADVAT
jgi:hypothetical protein